MPLLFVYGTLLSGFQNTFRQLLESQSSFLSTATIIGKLYDLGSYPGLILSDSGEDIVHGEVYELNNERLIRELDLYENYRSNDPNSLYLREMAPVRLEDGSSVHAIVYIYNKSIEKAIRIDGGNYKDYLDR